MGNMYSQLVGSYHFYLFAFHIIREWSDTSHSSAEKLGKYSKHHSWSLGM